MTPAALRATLGEAAPSAGLSAPVEALWWAAKGDWDRAHKLAQAAHNADGAWVHAYLHRVEGDLPNAHYWYGQAGRKPSSDRLDAEWNAIAVALLGT
jgi:hypothetical protein